jgi:hypothetical protein
MAESKTTILSSTQDNVLQPDAMRGSEQFLKDLNVVDEEADRREAQEGKTKDSYTAPANPTPPKTETKSS